MSVRVFFFAFLAVGLALMTADELYKRLNKDKFLRMDITISLNGYTTGSVKDEEEINRIRELFRSFAAPSNAVWFGVPDTSSCPVSVWDNWEESFYWLCRGRRGEWYVGIPGSYRGGDTTNYYRLEEKQAVEIIERLKGLINQGLDLNGSLE